MTLEERYAAMVATPSDINTHLPKLRDLASQCSHVTEFGVRGGVSTTALLAAQPDYLVCYDISYCPVIENLVMIRGKCNLSLTLADTAKVAIAPTDMLFIDTHHTGPQLTAELSNACRVRKYIAMHDTKLYGLIGDRGEPGLLGAIKVFLEANREWKQVYHTDVNCGLTVLERDVIQ